MTDQFARRKRNVEDSILALFDAHQRVVTDLNAKRDVVQAGDETSPSEVGIVIDARNAASRCIAETAVDLVVDELDKTRQRYDDREGER